jgi:selenocysteine-specific elongation factor
VRVVATAGHVDHGKSTLVLALTGTDPDRWPEEQARGLTIDLGFAATTLPSGAEIGFVDVPGHGRYVRNMLAGVGSVDACLFVVAATEGWKEQSEEHLRILELMGLSHGLVALTKVATVDRDWLDLVRLDLEERLAGTFLGGSEVVEVDVPAGAGLERLVSALDDLVGRVPASVDAGRPRLWVDRAFAVRGSGTVVTGTLTGGALTVEDAVTIEPGGLEGRVRSLQSHYSSMTTAGPGRRLAVNVAGVSHRDLWRGQAVVRPGQWHMTGCFDAGLSVLASLEHPVGSKGAYSLHTGSGDFPVRLKVIGASRLEPGQSGHARFWLRSGLHLPLVLGDRFVLREAGRFETVGGGEVLDVDPVRPASRTSPSPSVEEAVAVRGWVEADHLWRITGRRIDPTVGVWVVSEAARSEAEAGIVDRCRVAGPTGVALAELDDRARLLLKAGVESVVVREGRAFLEESAAGGLSDAARRALSLLEESAWTPPDLPLSDRGALRELQRAGLAFEAGPLWFAAVAVSSATERLAALLRDDPAGFTVAQARDALGSSRKHVLPLLGHLDSIGVTRRRGDVRVAGPRMVAAPGPAVPSGGGG